MTTRTILERQILMAQLMAQQIKPTAIVEQTMEETGCSESTAWATWGKRSEWLPLLVQAKDLGPGMDALLNAIREIRRLAMNQYYRARGAPAAQVGALNTARGTVMDEMKMRQSLGQIIQVPKKFKVEVNGTVNGVTIRDYFPELVNLVMEAQAASLNGAGRPAVDPEPVDPEDRQEG